MQLPEVGMRVRCYAGCEHTIVTVDHQLRYFWIDLKPGDATERRPFWALEEYMTVVKSPAEQTTTRRLPEWW
jgi:hypothetical protein